MIPRIPLYQTASDCFLGSAIVIWICGVKVLKSLFDVGIDHLAERCVVDIFCAAVGYRETHAAESQFLWHFFG